MRLLVTGATGFIGKALVQRLKSLNVKLRCTSRFEQKDQDYEWVVLSDYPTSEDWDKVTKGIDIVIHLAGLAHSNLKNEANIEKINYANSITLADSALRQGVKQFIFLSSILACDSTSNTPLSEDSPPNPKCAYGKMKLRTENAIISQLKNSSCRYTIIRPSLIYGKGVKGNLALLLKLLDSSIYLPFADLSNKRSFLYIENIVDVLQLCLLNNSAYNEVFHVTDPSPIEVSELCSGIRQALHRSKRMLRIPAGFFKIVSCAISNPPLNLILKERSNILSKLIDPFIVDASKAMRLLNWQPKWDTRQALAHWLSN